MNSIDSGGRRKSGKVAVRVSVALKIFGAIAAISFALLSPRVDAIPKIEFVGFDHVSSNRPMAVISISNGCSYPIWISGEGYYTGEKVKYQSFRWLVRDAAGVGLIFGRRSDESPAIPPFSKVKRLFPVPSENFEWSLDCWFSRSATKADWWRYRINQMAGDSEASRKIVYFGADPMVSNGFKGPVFPAYEPESE